MSDESYPLPIVSHLVRLVQSSDVSGIRRDWTGNDESARNHHGRVNLNESPLMLQLSWKHSPKDSVHLIGVYLRFYHGYDNLIYIQVNSNEPGLPIGRMP